MQIQNQAAQPIILQASPLQSQQILQVGQATAASTGMFINAPNNSTED